MNAIKCKAAEGNMLKEDCLKPNDTRIVYLHILEWWYNCHGYKQTAKTGWTLDFKKI